MKQKFQVSVSKVYIVWIVLLTVIFMGCYSSYAYFTVKKEKKEAIKLITGNLVGELKVNGEVSDKLVVSAKETKTFEIELINKNAKKARFNFYYKGSLKEGVEVGYIQNDGYNQMTQEKGVTLEANGTLGYYLKYQIKVVNNASDSVTIPLGYEVGLDYNDLTLPSDGHLFEETNGEARLAVETLLEDYTNSVSIQNYIRTNKSDKEKKMYVFNHIAGTQQSDWKKDELISYRYIGSDPDNYVTFNDETWRIIGIETVDDGTGKREKRIKLIKKDPLLIGENNNISWDNKPSGTGSSESDDGSNDWYDSRLMMVLNSGYDNNELALEKKGSLYWNRQSGSCPLGSGVTDCNFTDIGLKEEAQQMIGDAKWYLGGIVNYDSSENGTVNHFYSYERGEKVYQSSAHPRETSWTGRVGLIYPSDYGYATSGGNTTNQNSCLETAMDHWNEKEDCKNNDWLFMDGKDQWTISPRIDDSYNVFYVGDNGSVSYNNVINNRYVARPVVYLVSNIKLRKGTGSESNPFEFEL